MKCKLTQVVVVCLVVILPIAIKAGEKEVDKSHMVAALELLESMQVEITFEKTIESAVDLQVKQNPSIAPYRKVLLEFFSKYMSWDSLKDEMARIYVDAFTIQELKELTAFYKTPVGRKAALLVPQLMTKGGEMGMKRVQEHMPELQLMIAEEHKRITKEKISNKAMDSDKK